MQILHPSTGSIQDYCQELTDPQRHRPAVCPQCGVKKPLIAHGFYSRSLVAQGFDGVIRVRRYLCRLCRRTASLLPEFTLPYLRFALPTLGHFLQARLLEGRTLRQAAEHAGQPQMPYQRGQGWVARFRRQAATLVASLAGLTQPVPAPDFLGQALRMLHTAGWIRSHRFLFSQLRVHLFGWPPFLAPDGRSGSLTSPERPSPAHPHNSCLAPPAQGP